MTQATSAVDDAAAAPAHRCAHAGTVFRNADRTAYYAVAPTGLID
jgi:hypothetical protein